MERYYDERYFFSERHGGKEWVDKEGKAHQFGYAQGGVWDFQGMLKRLIGLLGTPRSVLDIGAGCGGFVSTINANFIDSLGLEFSDYALDNAIMGARKYLVKWDLEQVPWPVQQERYDWITAIDLFEHLFHDKVDDVIGEAKRRAGKWIVAKICTAKKEEEVWAARRAPMEQVIEQAKGEGFWWLVVSGHVNSQLPSYWIEKFVDDEWTFREDLAEKLKAGLPDDWRTTLVMERPKWFEEEFGRD